MLCFMFTGWSRYTSSSTNKENALLTADLNTHTHTHTQTHTHILKHMYMHTCSMHVNNHACLKACILAHTCNEQGWSENTHTNS